MTDHFILINSYIGTYIHMYLQTRTQPYRSASIRVQRCTVNVLKGKRQSIVSCLLQGFTKEFTTLTALITHHSVMPELLPCPLSLSRYNPSFVKSDSNKDFADIDSDPDYNTLADFRKMMADLNVQEERNMHYVNMFHTFIITSKNRHCESTYQRAGFIKRKDSHKSVYRKTYTI